MQGPATAADAALLESSIYVDEHVNISGEDGSDDGTEAVPALAPDIIALAEQYKCMLELPAPLSQDWTQLFDLSLYDFPPAPIPQVRSIASHHPASV